MTLPRSAPPLPAQPPARRAPDGACDTHIHMLAAPAEFALWEGRIEDPAADMRLQAYLDAYRAQMDVLGISRTVVVHSILYGADNAIALAAVQALGPEVTRAVVLVRDEVEDTHLDALAAAGAVAVRLNYVHGGLLSWEGVEAMAPRLAARGLHVQMLCQADQHMVELAPRIAAMPVPVVLDHFAWPNPATGAESEGFAALTRLVAEGHAWVKLSAPYRVCEAPFDALDAHARALIQANPERCLWGSDWPQIMLGGATRVDAGAALDAFDRVCPDEATRRQILVEAPAALYGF